MYVKNLTLRGFKSFASATSLTLEPGITCIVGPNGSGKSNVVDALAWVMGEQGAKTLRGGKMEDVIFAGTPARPPLGRAEVSLTIDNTDGALPIAYSEVTLTRTMFRSGGSDYALNGTPCRLLDIQELLSDSGIGREMHVVVGQGQLDSVLSATPQERRGFIEEAAGVLKHRRRKERALRKLDAMEANLTRIQDLSGEIRRQLGPLGRQAETARRAAVIQVDARDARCRLRADELSRQTQVLTEADAEEAWRRADRDQAHTVVTRARARVAQLQAAAAAGGPALAAARERWYALTSVGQRLAAVEALAAERLRLLKAAMAADDPAVSRSPDPQGPLDQGQRLRSQERELVAQLEAARAGLGAAMTHRRDAENVLTREQRRLSEVATLVADRREQLATLAGRVAARRSRIEAGAAEVGRLGQACEQVRARAAQAQAEFARLEGSVAVDEDGEEGLDGAYESAAAALTVAEEELAGLTDAERSTERDRSTAQARAEALELTLRRRDGAGSLLAGDPDRPAEFGGPGGSGRSGRCGVVGSVATMISVQPGHEAAVAAALGRLADAVVMDSLPEALAGLDRLKEWDAGRAGMLLPPPPRGGLPPAARTDQPPPAHGVWASSVVTCADRLRPVVDRLLAGVVLVPDRAAALEVVAGGDAEPASPGWTAVTPDGDVYDLVFVHGGGVGSPSVIELRSTLEDAREHVRRATHRREKAQFGIAAARQRHADRKAVLQAALADLHASDARMAALAEQLASWGSVLRATTAERTRSENALADALEGLDRDRRDLADAEAALAAAHDGPLPAEPTTDERQRLESAAVVARAAETEARLRVGTLLERAKALAGRAEASEAAARDEQLARQQAGRERERRADQARLATAVREAARYAQTCIEAAVAWAEHAHTHAVQQAAERDGSLARLRRDAETMQARLRELTDSVHRDEVANGQLRLRVDTLRSRAVEELGLDPDVLVGEFGPHLRMADGSDYRREVQEKRLRAAERQLSQLGRINPLALEEYSALEERHTFLTEQLDDLKRSKRDLLDIVREVDARVQAVFAEAFADTAEQFEGVFARLFPGGQGRLVLTDPDDLLSTGVEVEARPPGKRIKRLSLLSGGERSLTAVALLLAIFMARPSPFYILDEVEAALDETNLGRLLSVLSELRESSQLIVITHQKRTMEVADALYGVSMRGDGVTTVVSQRLRDARPA